MMQDLIFMIISGVTAIATFVVIAKKFGSECIP
jgi:hypothetical protein